MHKPIADTMKRIQQALQGHFNYFGVNGNLAQMYKFWKYVKYSYFRVLNKRHQKRSMSYNSYLRIWNYYVTEAHLTKDIWNWKPKINSDLPASVGEYTDLSYIWKGAIIMGLIKAGIGALGGTLAEQWKEFFYCESMP